MSADLIVIIPTRTRPRSVAEVAAAWADTGAWSDGAELLFVVDRDDPEHDEYHAAVQAAARHYQESVSALVAPSWRPMVPKLNDAALRLAEGNWAPALGFAGDDHRPRTRGWVRAHLDALREIGSGWASCPDGYRTDRLPTQWAVTSDIVRALGRMVPAPVEHLYCDDSTRDLAEAAGAYAYLDEHLVEHLHPVAGHAGDEQHARVNSARQYKVDKRAYRAWKKGDITPALATDVELVRVLRETGETI